MNRNLSLARPQDRVRAGSLTGLGLMVLFAVCLSACGGKTPPPSAAPPVSATAEAEREGARIFEQYRGLDKSKDSMIRMQVKIVDDGGQSRGFDLRISRKRDADGRLSMLSEFLAPAEERDRNALLVVEPQGEIEGTRYMQANDSFATVKGAVNEDSLFGMTVQEMVDGQPEKYDFRLTGEETFNSMPVYRLDGTLKKGMDSKFPRLVVLIAKANYAVVGAEFYDNKNELLRRVTVTEVKQVNGYWTRMHWVIDNLAKKKKLEFDVEDVKYDQNLPASFFTKENLKKTSFKAV